MDLLNRLNIKAINPGAFSSHGWCSELNHQRLQSFNPTNGELLAEVATCTQEDYEQLMSRAEQAALAWKKVPHLSAVKLLGK